MSKWVSPQIASMVMHFRLILSQSMFYAHWLLPTFCSLRNRRSATSRTRQPWERVAPCNSHTLDKSTLATVRQESPVRSSPEKVCTCTVESRVASATDRNNMVSRVTLATVKKESRREPRGWSEESRDCDRANRGASEMGPACDGQRRVTHWRPKEAQSSDCICVRFDVVIYWISALFYNL